MGGSRKGLRVTSEMVSSSGPPNSLSESCRLSMRFNAPPLDLTRPVLATGSLHGGFRPPDPRGKWTTTGTSHGVAQPQYHLNSEEAGELGD